jgi:hypothetical protein
MREICMSGSTRGREGRGFTPLPPVLLYRSSVAIILLLVVVLFHPCCCCSLPSVAIPMLLTVERANP